MQFEQSLPTSRKEALAIGSRFYENGRTCPHGHASKYVTKEYKCYECYLMEGRQRQARRYERHGYIPKDETAASLCKHTRRYLLLQSYRARHSKRLGCTGAALRTHIESLFMPGMSWASYGRGAGQWQIDHVIPLSKFDLHDPVQGAKAAHYTNTQPLWSGDNARKSWLQ